MVVDEIRMWDTHDIQKIASDRWWQKFIKKNKFILSPSSKPLYISANDVSRLGFDRNKN